MSEKTARPSLPTSSSDFALPPSSALAPSPDETNPLLFRFRRPSILAPKATYFSESRLTSPLVTSFSIPSPKIGQRRLGDAELENERWTDSSPSSSSENPTPPLGFQFEDMEPSNNRSKRRKRMPSPGPSTPPPQNPSATMEIQDSFKRLHARRLSHSIKPARIANILAEESRPEESEVRSEAAFQRLLASYSEAPTHPRTPRAPSDRGRYPEEAGEDDPQREDTPSDDFDGDDPDFAPPPATSASDPINIAKPSTPANSVCGDDMAISESPGMAMDVDSMPISGSPSISSAHSISHWRHTPPPTTGATRSTKRKLDDRFDPYPSASKRRAVSPSMSLLRDSHSRSSNGKLPMAISIPPSTASSAASSPTLSSAYARPLAMPINMTCSSPTMRASMGLASPVMRPVPRTGSNGRRMEEEAAREVEGAGEGVNGIRLGK